MSYILLGCLFERICFGDIEVITFFNFGCRIGEGSGVIVLEVRL